jgi:hypothetical protein
MKTENLCFNRRLGVNSCPSPADGLRLELNPKCFHVLPYHHLELVTFESGEGQDRLSLSFLNRIVRITGKNLRALGLAFQDRTVEFVKPLPERYSARPSDEAWVKTIEIEDKSERG